MCSSGVLYVLQVSWNAETGGDSMKKIIPAIPLSDLEGKQICTDPFGSYTGLVTDPHDKPVQDADDL